MDPHTADVLAYQHLVADLRRGSAGGRSAAAVAEICRRAGRTAADLVADLLAERPPASGDPCPHCEGGKLRVASSRPVADHWQAQRLACGACGARPLRSTSIVPAATIRRRRRD